MEFRTRRTASPGSRRIIHGGSASTGTITFPSAFDQYQGPSRSSVGFISGPRTSTERVGVSRALPRYRHESPPRQSARDDYVVRPRRLTLDVPNAPTRRPLSFVPPGSPSRLRPIITSAVDNPPVPVAAATRSRRDEEYYIQPASSSTRREHRQHYSHGSIDSSRMGSGDRDARDRWEHGVYRRPGSIRGAYHTDPPYYRTHDLDERDPGYEYTDRREQVYRDTEPRPRTRRESDAGRPERPLSMAGLEEYLPRVNHTGRDVGPPVAMDTRGFSGGGRTNMRAGSLRHSHPRWDNELPRDYIHEDYGASQPRHTSRVPLIHQNYPQNYPTHHGEARDPAEGRSRKPSISERRDALEGSDHLEEEYGRTVDDRSKRYHDRGHRRGHERDDRDYRMREDDRARAPEISTNELLASAAASAAAAGVAVENPRRRHRRHDRHKEHNDPAPKREPDDDRGRRTKGEDHQEDSSSSTGDSDEEKREQRGRHRPHREPSEDKEGDDRRKEAEPGAPSAETVVREESSHETHTLGDSPRIEEPSRSGHRHRRHHSRTQEKDSYSEDSTSSETRDARDARDARDKKTRQVRVVTPSEDHREPEPPIRGILRPPREKFPEDPAPVREGVAPLKDAGKKGIPPNARWTKIDRRLVNPEALEVGNERFEERPDYVIVLRVLTKEEIEAYALKTQEIRAKRGIPPMIHDAR